jgi:4-hydroxybenzoate-CoA ligase
MAIDGKSVRRVDESEAIGNAVDFFLDRHVREGRGRCTAFIDEAGSITYAALCDATAAFARAMERADIHREARIALILHDSIAFPIAFWGALRAGIVPVPINTLLPAAQIRHILEDCRAEAAIVSAALLTTLAPTLAEVPALRLIVIAGDTATNGEAADPERLPARCLALTAFIADNDDFIPSIAAGADDLAFLLYTSGSTGAPKGVRHVHGSLRATADTYGAQVLGITAEDVIFSVAKLFFAYGLGNSMTFPLSVGAAAVLSPHRVTPDHVLAMIARHRPSIFCGVPTLYAKLVNHAKLGQGAGSDRLRCCVSAGEALPALIGARWAAITGVDILDGVGTTEMLHIFLSNRPGAVRYGACGRAVPGYDLRLVDENGDQIEGEGEGELLVRGKSVADGYWNQPAKTRLTFRGEWTVTGDRFTRDAGGVYRYCGRTDDMMKVSGIWVSPIEVEASLISHDAVLAAAVVAHQDDDGLTKPRAFVVIKPHLTASVPLLAELREHVKQQIGVWKYPRWIDIVPNLPETANGKIQRFKLRTERLPWHLKSALEKLH